MKSIRLLRRVKAIVIEITTQHNARVKIIPNLFNYFFYSLLLFFIFYTLLKGIYNTEEHRKRKEKKKKRRGENRMFQ